MGLGFINAPPDVTFHVRDLQSEGETTFHAICSQCDWRSADKDSPYWGAGDDYLHHMQETHSEKFEGVRPLPTMGYSWSCYGCGEGGEADALVEAVTYRHHHYQSDHMGEKVAKPRTPEEVLDSAEAAFRMHQSSIETTRRAEGGVLQVYYKAVCQCGYWLDGPSETACRMEADRHSLAEVLLHVEPQFRAHTNADIERALEHLRTAKKYLKEARKEI